jgi:hypothetical protein
LGISGSGGKDDSCPVEDEREERNAVPSIEDCVSTSEDARINSDDLLPIDKVCLEWHVHGNLIIIPGH